MTMNRNKHSVCSIVVLCLLLLSMWFMVLVSVPLNTTGIDHNNETISLGTDITWFASDNPHNVTGDIIVYGNLTIEPGAIIKFSNNANIYVYGGLFAIGEQNNRINFTHNSSWLGTSKWGEIKFGTGSYGSMRYCNISRGGKSSLATIQISTTNNILIENCKINYSGDNGIYIDEGNSIVQNNTIHDCPTGIEVEGGGPIIYNNTIFNASAKGIDVLGGSVSIIKNEISNSNEGFSVLNPATIIKFDNNQILNCQIGIWTKKQFTVENSTIQNSTNYDFHLASPPTVNIYTRNTTFNNSKNLVESNSHIYKQWYVHIEVTDSFSAPMDGSTINITPTGTGQPLPTYYTDEAGWKLWLWLTECEISNSGQTNYTPHTIEVTFSGYNKTMVQPKIDRNQILELQIIDNQFPTSSASATKYWYNIPLVTVYFNANDNAELENIKLFYNYSSDNESFSNPIEANSKPITGVSVSDSFTFGFQNGSGYYQFYTQASDKVGLDEVSTGADTVVGYDGEPPEVISWDSDNITEDSTSDFRVNVTFRDEHSGLSGLPTISFKYDSTKPNWDISDQPMIESSRQLRGDKTFYSYLPAPVTGWEEYEGLSVAWQIISSDLAGNMDVTYIYNEYVDYVNHAPTVQIIEPTNDEWYSGTIKIRTIPSDDQDDNDPPSEWGIAQVNAQYSLDSQDGSDGSWENCNEAPVTGEPFDIYWDTTDFTTEPSVWLRANTVDNGGLISPWATVRIKLDNEPATTSVVYDDLWRNTDFQLNLTANDGIGTGVQNIYYRVNNEKALNTYENGMPRINQESVNNTLEYWSVDNQSNEEPHKFLYEIKLDKTKPTIADILLANITVITNDLDDVNILVNISDSLSGLNHYPSYRLLFPDDLNYTDWQLMVPVAGDQFKGDIKLPKGKKWLDYSGGEIKIEIKATDIADNSRNITLTELIDEQANTPPIISHKPVTSWELNIQINIKATITDDKGVEEAYVNYKGVGSDSFVSVPMLRQGSSDIFSSKLPAQDTEGTLYYYITAWDNFLAVNLPEFDPEKNAFAIEILGEDINGDGDDLPDWWVEQYFGDIEEYIAADDPDDDGLTNMEEYQNGTDPTDADSDEDGLPDGWELKHDLDPTNPGGDHGAYGDPDGDGVPNLDEYLEDTEPTEDKPKPKGESSSQDLTAMYIGIIIVMVVIILFLVFTLFRGKKNKPTQPEDETIEEDVTEDESNPGHVEDVEYKEELVLECPDCGSIVSEEATVCPTCGVEFDEEIEDATDEFDGDELISAGEYSPETESVPEGEISEESYMPEQTPGEESIVEQQAPEGEPEDIEDEIEQIPIPEGQ